ncbi:MAG: hypothetical protein LUH21_04220 [Clostridiales bacterium]|nr:hypothetical protein [Clostridiales bacterium]
MGNLTYNAAFRKQQKVSYRGLDDNQKKYIKAKELYEQMEKTLNFFYSHCKRNQNGVVDFESLSSEELDAFEWWNKQKDKAFSKMSKLENIIDVDFTLNLFLQINTHSMSF